MSIRRFVRNSSGYRTSSSRADSARRAPVPQIVEPLESRTMLAATPAIGIYAPTPSASETNPKKSGHGEFIVKRTGVSTAKALTLQYYVGSSSTARAGQDYYTLAGTVTIKAGQSYNFFNLYPIDDAIHESDETVVVVLKARAGYTIGHSKAVITIHDNDPEPSVGWFDNTRRYRTALDVNVGSTARTDQPAERSINFTTVLSSLGRSGSLVDDSIKVIEVSADGQTVINDNVPFQFDKDSDFNASSNASGNLVILLNGTTAANATRHYQVYFDTTGSFSAPSVTSLVSVDDDGVSDEGFDSILISNQVADFYYQKAEGGFSSIVDTNGNDWVSWNDTSGSAGEYRGVPNHGNIGFHPGRDHDVTTVIVSQGPLKTTLESTDSAGNKVRWEFYPKFARETVINMNQDYWFLYEGTPGGSINGSDTVVQSDGTTTGIDEEWSDSDGLGSGNGEEWIYFRDSAVGSSGRYLYAVHNTPDGVTDTYWDMENKMTVFGFGRYTSLPDHGTSTPLLSSGSDLNDQFTIGLADGGGSFSSASATINGAYKSLTVMLGSGEVMPS
jgi:hypothetical protein